MKNVIFTSLAACLVLVSGCRWPGIQGNGKIRTDQRPVGAFANIDVRGAFEIEWQNGAPSLQITTDENLLPYIDSGVSGDTLRLRTREQIRPSHSIKVVMSSPTRTGAKISGAVKMAVKQLNGPRFAMECSGASRVSLDGNVDQLLADMTEKLRTQAILRPSKNTSPAPGLFAKKTSREMIEEAFAAANAQVARCLTRAALQRFSAAAVKY